MKVLMILLMSLSFIFASIDINSADTKDLVTLKGIGAKKAEAIIAFRKSHCFKTVEELVKVKGIGKKTVEKNRANLKAGFCKK